MTGPKKLSLVVISGGLGSPSSSQRLADLIARHAAEGLESYGVHADVSAIEVRELMIGVAHKLGTGVTEPDLAFALDALRHSDGVIAVTPVFNGQMAGHFKSFFDMVDPGSLRGIPVALGATGGSPRHSLVIEMNLRPLFAYLRAFPLPTGAFATSADFIDDAERLEERAATLGRELAESMMLLRTPTQTAVTHASPEARSLLATDYDYSEQGLREREIREQHENFANLLERYAHANPDDE
ncbi:MAG: CE1759 family FMN reductase [Canibacter sp.]